MKNENFVYYRECTNFRKTFPAIFFLDKQVFTDETTTNDDGSIISISNKSELISNHSNQQYDAVVDSNTMTNNINGEDFE